MWFFFQILVLIFTDLCGKSLREKNGDTHKGIQNVTICIVTCLKYRDTYCDKNSVLLHSYSLVRPPFLHWKSGLINGVTSLERDHWLVFYYLSTFDTWPDKRCGFWWEGPYNNSSPTLFRDVRISVRYWTYIEQSEERKIDDEFLMSMICKHLIKLKPWPLNPDVLITYLSKNMLFFSDYH